MSSTEEKIAALRQQYMDNAGDQFEHWLFRDLVAGGWKVLRYTGSEIYSNVDLAYDEICGHLNRAYDRTA